jgi:S-adenosylmethionine hydrolase
VDRFGNLQLNCRDEEVQFQPGAQLQVGDARALYGSKFADAVPGELVLYPDAAGFLALAANQGSASRRLNVRPGDALEIGPV